MRLKPTTSLSAVKQRLGYGGMSVRESPQRKRHLERVARVISAEDIRVRLHSGGAACMPMPKSAGSDMLILIPRDEAPQPVTDISTDVWDLLFQETELFHELGHVLYTSWEAWEPFITSVHDTFKQVAKEMFNAAEDGAIETQLAADFNIENDLTVKNMNLSKASDEGRGSLTGSGRIEYSFLDAVGIGLLDMGYYDSGRFREILDPDNGDRVIHTAEGREAVVEMVPHMRDLMADFLSTPSGEARVERYEEYWDEVEPIINRLRQQKSSELEHHQGDEGRPDDADPERLVFNGSEEADELPDEEEASEHVAQVVEGPQEQVEGGDEQQEQDAAEAGSGMGQETAGDSGGDEQSNGDAAGEQESGETEQESADISQQPAQAGQQEQDAGEDADDSGGFASPDPEPDPEAHERPEEDGEAAGEGGQDESEEADEDAEDGAAGAGEGEGDEDGDEQDADEDAGSDTVGGDVDDEDLEQIEEDLEQKYGDDVQSEREEMEQDGADEAMEREVEEILNMFKRQSQASGGSGGGGAGGGGLGDVEVVEPYEFSGEADLPRWLEIQRKGGQLVNILRTQLQRNREDDDLVHGQRRGRVDTQSLARAVGGDTNVFSQVKDSEEKDYQCLIVLDRSGSMDGHRMEAAEEATGQLAFALDEIGVDVQVMSLSHNTPTVEVPFGGDLNRYWENLVTAQVGGGTPMTQMVELGNERLGTGDGEVSFMVVITDGQPSEMQNFKAELDRTNFPLYGVVIDNQSAFDDLRQHFDRAVPATANDVSMKVRELAQNVLPDHVGA